MNRSVRDGLIIFVVAFALRAFIGLSANPIAPFAAWGGDSAWYLVNGEALVQEWGDPRPAGSGRIVRGIPTDVSNLPTPPLYLAFIGIAQGTFPADFYAYLPAQTPERGAPVLFLGMPTVVSAAPGAVILVRLIQATLGAVTCLFAARLSWQLTKSRRGALLAGGLLAVAPAFILESAQIASETLYMFLLAGGLWAYGEGVRQGIKPLVPPEVQNLQLRKPGNPLKRVAIPPDHSPQPTSVGLRFSVARGFEPLAAGWLFLAATLLACATLTRAALLLFPIALAGHWIIVHIRRERRRGIFGALLLIFTYAAVVGTWTIYNLQWDRFVVAGDGITAFIYIGATGTDDPQAIDARLAESNTVGSYGAAAGAAITSDPLAYVRRRVGELVGAILQPHGTAYFPGESLRALIGDWAQNDRTPGGFARIAAVDAFIPKLALYGYHYTVIGLGLIGLWRTRRNTRVMLPLAGFILYTLLLHLFLFALPRYLFPTLFIWTIFAAVGIASLRPHQSRGVEMG